MEKEQLLDAVGVSQKRTIQVTERFLLNSLTSRGYDPYSALSELIDNSIDADATEIDITVNKDVITIKDNGTGMSEEKLIESMNLGSNREYEENHIGYFGQGMNSGLINLIDMDKNGYVEIETTDKEDTTKAKWMITQTPFNFETESWGRYCDRGTTISIHNPLKIQAGALKNKLAVIFYPALKNDEVLITVNGDKVIGIDPLYRDQNPDMNIMEATVGDDVMTIEGVLLNDTIEKHSWDSRHKNWKYEKGGVYVIYGKRYITLGGMLKVVGVDPWFSRTRMEITILKKYTKEFNVPDNKIDGIASLDHPMLDELKRKIKDTLLWGVNVRKKKGMNDVPQQMKEEQDKLNEKFNKIAARAGVKKPNTPEEEVEKRTKRKLVSFTVNPDGEHFKTTNNKSKSVIKQNKTFDFTFDDLGSEFWQVGYINKRFNIVMNNKHPFYHDIYQRMDEETKLHMMNFMGSLAMAQYKTLDLDNLNGSDIVTFWEEYWMNFSFSLKKMIQNT